MTRPGSRERARHTGRRWKRPARHCPDWCAGSKTWCAAREGYPNGEHRSAPLRLRARGPLGAVVSLARPVDAEQAAIEVRLWLPLGQADERAAANRALIKLAAFAEALAVELTAKTNYRP